MRSLVAALAVVLLAGCETPGVQRSGGAVTIDQKPAAGQGHVLLRMLSARPSGVFVAKWQMLRLARDGAAGEELYDISGPQASGSLFYARLPAGTYRITDVQTVGPGPGLLLALLAGDYQDLSARALRFTVREGALTNLGTVVDSPPVDNDPKTRRVVLLRGAPGQAAAVEAVTARTGQAIALRAEGGWAGEESPQEAERALRRARALMSVVSRGEDATGRTVVFGGTALGQILMRDAAGQWSAETLDTLAAVTCARRLADGTLLAGTEDGRIYERRPGGAWRALRLRDAAAPVLHLEPAPGGGWFATTQKLNEVALFRVDAAGAQSAAIATLDTGGALYAGTLANDTQLMMPRNTPAFARTSQWTIVDKQSLRVERKEEKFLVFAFQRLKGGEVFMDRYSGLSHYVSYSADGGRSWSHVQTEGPLYPHFIDAQRGWALDFTRGAFSVDSYIVKTVDGGRTWARTGAAQSVSLAGRILGIAPDGTIVADLGWEVRSSRDEGKTWRRERPLFVD